MEHKYPGSGRLDSGSDRIAASIAVISDIHGNAPALRAVLDDISRRGIDTIINLGDSLFGPIDPVGTAELLMGDSRILHIQGNCDEILLQESADSATFAFVKPRLTPHMLEWIRSFPATRAFDNLFFCHGTPEANDRYLLEKVTEEGVRLKSSAKLASELAGFDHDYIFCGHSHVFRTKKLPDGRTIVNAGSVGLPAYEDELPFPHAMESGSPDADYASLERRPDGSWEVRPITVPYDFESAAVLAEHAGRADYAFAIRTGRALR
ncbi:metallophosphoesterase family protein [Saccharibacillus deserti]|uniref:metallophosphoesterase family protein n=1 Tax=Saccharibacillus deserti TaxID=1634444 RepID=UPI001557D12A|nr:metallophosphoesterase family protein [Saccharibacillus deserti]